MARGPPPKRERQYEHVLHAEGDRGISGKRAEEITARTVDKARARHGEAARMDKPSSNGRLERNVRRGTARMLLVGGLLIHPNG